MIVVKHWILSGLSLDNVSLCPFPLSFLLIWIHKSQKEWKPPLQKRRRGEKYNVVHAIRTFFKTRRKKGRDFLYVDHFCIITPIMIAVIYLFCDKPSITHLINLNIFNPLTIPWSQNKYYHLTERKLRLRDVTDLVRSARAGMTTQVQTNPNNDWATQAVNQFLK